jgi:tellurium resistance protein TerD
MKRGANASLTREIPGLSGIVLGIRADAGPETELTDNLVVAAVLADQSGRAISGDHFVFFNQLATPELSVEKVTELLGPDRDQIEIDLDRVPESVLRIVVVAYVNEGMARRRTLGRLRRCEVRVLNLAGGAELVRSENLADGLENETAIALAEVYRHQTEWKFRVLGAGYADGILGLARDYGLNL